MDPNAITLSPIFQAYLASLTQSEEPEAPLEGERFEVSQTVSFFGFIYEKLRNAVEFNEEHLVRRLTITRILRRRFSINPQGKGESENLVRELLWGRYLAHRSITLQKVKEVQHIIDSYVYFLHLLGRKKIQGYSSSQLGNLILEFLSCEIEESLNQKLSYTKTLQLHFFYQSLRNKISIKNVSEDNKDLFFYVGTEEAFMRNDKVFIAYHIFTLHFGPLSHLSKTQIETVTENFAEHIVVMKKALKNPYRNNLTKFAKKQAAPFRILFSIIDEAENSNDIVTNKELLQKNVEETCMKKSQETSIKIRNAAVRSVIYIFLTKMVFVLLLEIPASKYIYHQLHLIPLAINTIFPPILMGLIVTLVNPASTGNAVRIYSRIIDILSRDPEAPSHKTVISHKGTLQQSSRFFIFTIIYIVVFGIIFSGLYAGLELLGFNIINKTVFIFFVSVIAFFGYRIRQTAKEYVLESESNILMSFVTFLFLPILYIGKWLSSQISKINLYIVFFDYLIEAPFKLLIEVAEEWIKFVKARKDELI